MLISLLPAICNLGIFQICAVECIKLSNRHQHIKSLRNAEWNVDLLNNQNSNLQQTKTFNIIFQFYEVCKNNKQIVIDNDKARQSSDGYYTVKLYCTLSLRLSHDMTILEWQQIHLWL